MKRSQMRFVLLVLAYSVILFAVERWMYEAGIYRSGMTGYLVPIVAIMLAAQGVSLRRRLTFVALTVGVFVAVDVLALVSGTQAQSFAVAGAGAVAGGTAGAAYQAFLRVFPLVALALFVGRRPQDLWGR